jgi:hypothetical protein
VRHLNKVPSWSRHISLELSLQFSCYSSSHHRGTELVSSIYIVFCHSYFISIPPAQEPRPTCFTAEVQLPPFLCVATFTCQQPSNRHNNKTITSSFNNAITSNRCTVFEGHRLLIGSQVPTTIRNCQEACCQGHRPAALQGLASHFLA